MFIDFRTSFQDLMSLRKEMEGFLKHPDNKRDYQPNLSLSIINVHELNRMELKCGFIHKSNWSNEPLRAARSMKFMCKLVSAIRRIQVGGPPAIGDERRPKYTVMMSDGEQNRKGVAKHVDDDEESTEEAGPTEKDVENKPDDLVFDAVGAQRAEQDPAQVQAHFEEAERLARNAARQEAELAAEADAMVGLVKFPPVPPANKSKHEAMSTGVDVDNYIARSFTGLRTKSNSGAETIFHR
jgi:hypothetical protein